MARGEVMPAKIAHHRTHLTEKNISDPHVALAWDNLEALCQACHNEEHHRTPRARYGFDEEGNVIPPSSPRY
jgi:5-methylcytosine-specific restriction endonuclease McrA